MPNPIHTRRRINPNAAPSILLDATAWYRSDRLITLNGSTVSAWGDLTGNGNTATQDTEANQLTYVQSAINGKPALQSDGSDGLTLTAPLFGTSAMSVFFAAHIVPNSGNQVWARQLDSGLGAPYEVFLPISDNKVGLFVRGDANEISRHSTVLTEGDYIIGVRFDGLASSANRVRISINGDSETLGNDATSVSAVDGEYKIFRTDASQPVNGSQLAEKVTFDTAVSDDEFDSIMQYTASRYGITLA